MAVLNSERRGAYYRFTHSLFEVPGIMKEAFIHRREEKYVMTKRTDTRICVKRKRK
jgi:hypothetical protein